MRKYTVLDVQSWDRSEHFHFFQSRRNPCVSIVTEIEITNLLGLRKELGFRLSDALYYFGLIAVNGIPEFRMRMVDQRPVLYDAIDGAFTYVPAGRTLHANCFVEFAEDFGSFEEGVTAARGLADQNPTLCPKGGESQGVVYFTNVHSLYFTAFTNPWDDPMIDSVPRIAFGKTKMISGDRTLIPVGIEALHSFVDGVHLGAFVDRLSGLFDCPERCMRKD